MTLPKQILLPLTSAFLIKPDFMQWRRFVYQHAIRVKFIFDIEFTVPFEQSITDTIYHCVIVTGTNHRLK
jgi:hypothetical protein